MAQFKALHSTTRFELVVVLLKILEIVVAYLESNISYLEIGHALELLVNKPKVILGIPTVPLYHVVV